MNTRIALLLVFVVSLCSAQSKRVEHTIFAKKDGIELDIINSIAFDNDEFLWLAGGILDNREIINSEKELSLQRFNGQTFHSIPIPIDENGYMVSQLHKRKDGTFYVNLDERLFVFDPFSTQFNEVTFPDSFISNIFTFNTEDYVLSQEGRILTLNKLHQDTTFEPLYSFTSNENKFLIEGSTTTLTCFEDYCIIGDDNFPMMAIAWDGTLLKTWDRYYKSKTTTLTKKKRFIDESFQLNGETYSFLLANPHLHKVNEEEMLLEPLTGFENSLVNQHLQIYDDPYGETLIATGNKEELTLSRFDATEGFITEFHDPEFGLATAMKMASKNVKDEVWLALNGELHHFKFPKKNIKNFLLEHSLRGMTGWKDGKSLVATDGAGWFLLDIEKNKVEPFKIFRDDTIFKPVSTRNFFIEGNTMWSNSGAYILELDIPSKTAKTYKHHPISSLVRPTDSTLVYGTYKYHLMEFNTNTKEHHSLVFTDSLDIADIHYDKTKHQIIAGTDKGLLVYDLNQKTSTIYNRNTELPDPYILSIEYHETYGYLLGTRKGHLVGFSTETESFTPYYEDDLGAGIASVMFHEDTWWINTFNGLVSFEPKTKHVTRFSTIDGLSHNEGNRHSTLYTQDGFLIGNMLGLNFFDPETLNAMEIDSEIRVLRIRRYDANTKQVEDEFNKSILSNNSTIVLPAEHKELQIDYALTRNLDYSEHRFRYRLNDEAWVDINSEQSIRFPNLAPGAYSLELEALDFSGKRIGTPLLLSINSEDFFYKTWWFYLIVSISTALLLLYFLRQALEKRRRQEKFSEALLNSQEMERTRISKELHDSVGQQLTLIKQKAQVEELNELSNLTNQALEEVRSISRGLYPANLKLLGLTESLEQLVLDFDEQTPIFFSSEMDTIDSYFNKDQTLHVYRFVQECLSNILKHAEAQAVSLTVAKKANHIVVEIEDNGIGFNVSESIRKNSLGIKTITERIRILKGILTIDSIPTKGTTIRAEIPL